MIKKQADGKYYKKIVEWNKNNNPQAGIHFGWALFGGTIGSCLGLIGNYSKELMQISLVFFIFCIISFIASFFETHDRKVKFERISK